MSECSYCLRTTFWVIAGACVIGIITTLVNVYYVNDKATATAAIERQNQLAECRGEVKTFLDVYDRERLRVDAERQAKELAETELSECREWSQAQEDDLP